MGHSLQAISLLVHSAGGQLAAIPLTSRIHEGLVFSNRDSRTLLDKLVALLFSITRVWGRRVVLVADAYYASGKVITPLLNKGKSYSLFRLYEVRIWCCTLRPSKINQPNSLI
jgi:hypothetical protein